MAKRRNLDQTYEEFLAELDSEMRGHEFGQRRHSQNLPREDRGNILDSVPKELAQQLGEQLINIMAKNSQTGRNVSQNQLQQLMSMMQQQMDSRVAYQDQDMAERHVQSHPPPDISQERFLSPQPETLQYQQRVDTKDQHQEQPSRFEMMQRMQQQKDFLEHILAHGNLSRANTSRLRDLMSQLSEYESPQNQEVFDYGHGSQSHDRGSERNPGEDGNNSSELKSVKQMMSLIEMRIAAGNVDPITIQKYKDTYYSLSKQVELLERQNQDRDLGLRNPQMLSPTTQQTIEQTFPRDISSAVSPQMMTNYGLDSHKLQEHKEGKSSESHRHHSHERHSGSGGRERQERSRQQGESLRSSGLRREERKQQQEKSSRTSGHQRRERGQHEEKRKGKIEEKRKEKIVGSSDSHRQKQRQHKEVSSTSSGQQLPHYYGHIQEGTQYLQPSVGISAHQWQEQRQQVIPLKVSSSHDTTFNPGPGLLGEPPTHLIQASQLGMADLVPGVNMPSNVQSQMQMMVPGVFSQSAVQQMYEGGSNRQQSRVGTKRSAQPEGKSSVSDSKRRRQDRHQASSGKTSQVSQEELPSLLDIKPEPRRDVKERVMLAERKAIKEANMKLQEEKIRKERAHQKAMEEATKYCKVCNITAYGKLSFKQHLAGKKHMQAVRMAELDSRYPELEAMPVTIKEKLKYEAFKLKGEREWYCSICEDKYLVPLPIEPHLLGKRHMQRKQQFKDLATIQAVTGSDEKAMSVQQIRCTICKIELKGIAEFEKHLQSKQHESRVLFQVGCTKINDFKERNEVIADFRKAKMDEKALFESAVKAGDQHPTMQEPNVGVSKIKIVMDKLGTIIEDIGNPNKSIKENAIDRANEVKRNVMLRTAGTSYCLICSCNVGLPNVKVHVQGLKHNVIKESSELVMKVLAAIEKNDIEVIEKLVKEYEKLASKPSEENQWFCFICEKKYDDKEEHEAHLTTLPHSMKKRFVSRLLTGLQSLYKALVPVDSKAKQEEMQSTCVSESAEEKLHKGEPDKMQSKSTHVSEPTEEHSQKGIPDEMQATCVSELTEEQLHFNKPMILETLTITLTNKNIARSPPEEDKSDQTRMEVVDMIEETDEGSSRLLESTESLELKEKDSQDKPKSSEERREFVDGKIYANTFENSKTEDAESRKSGISEEHCQHFDISTFGRTASVADVGTCRKSEKIETTEPSQSVGAVEIEKIETTEPSQSVGAVEIEKIEITEPSLSVGAVEIEKIETTEPSQSVGAVEIEKIETTEPSQSVGAVEIEKIEITEPSLSMGAVEIEKIKITEPSLSMGAVEIEKIKTTEPSQSVCAVEIEKIETTGPSQSVGEVEMTMVKVTEVTEERKLTKISEKFNMLSRQDCKDVSSGVIEEEIKGETKKSELVEDDVIPGTSQTETMQSTFEQEQSKGTGVTVAEERELTVINEKVNIQSGQGSEDVPSGVIGEEIKVDNSDNLDEKTTKDKKAQIVDHKSLKVETDVEIQFTEKVEPVEPEPDQSVPFITTLALDVIEDETKTLSLSHQGARIETDNQEEKLTEGNNHTENVEDEHERSDGEEEMDVGVFYQDSDEEGLFVVMDEVGEDNTDDDDDDIDEDGDGGDDDVDDGSDDGIGNDGDDHVGDDVSPDAGSTSKEEDDSMKDEDFASGYEEEKAIGQNFINPGFYCMACEQFFIDPEYGLIGHCQTAGHCRRYMENVKDMKAFKRGNKNLGASGQSGPGKSRNHRNHPTNQRGLGNSNKSSNQHNRGSQVSRQRRFNARSNIESHGKPREGSGGWGGRGSPRKNSGTGGGRVRPRKGSGTGGGRGRQRKGSGGGRGIPRKVRGNRRR
ncbi:uncharacterized protein LOC144437896 [Glandiceps talaboti]